MTRFAQAFRTPDLRKKLIFTSCIIVVFRFGSALPAPGISAPNVRYCSGLETSRGAAANVYAVLNVFSGMSVLIFTSVIAVVFGEFEQIYLTRGIPLTLAAIVVVVAVIGFVVFIEQAQRRIPVQYARRMTGRRVYGGATTYIPVKVNQAGVVPVIFASSLLAIPQLAASVLGNQNSPQGWVAWADRYLVPGVHVFPVYYLAFFVLIIAFTYFYVSITFNPAEVADNTRKYGGFVPGLRPGPPTASYLGYVVTRLTAPGAVYLAVIAMLPMVALGMIGIGSQALFSGVSLLIMVGVGLDTVKQVESQLQQHHYAGFLVTGTSEAPAALTVS